jgi:3-methyladenine DNA glycosylase AlkC
MADALKNFFDAPLVDSLAGELARVYPALKRQGFVSDALLGLEALELTARGAHLAEVMRRHLPADYTTALRVLVRSFGPELESSESFGMAPFRYLPHACFIAKFGLDDFEASMGALFELTKRFTAEGGIRPFIVKYPEQTQALLVRWASNPNVHVRRLVSEGMRPRLPWAPRLRELQKDPARVLELLELLKDDTQRYVQRSVANNLNDIAKDHPDRVVSVCRRWSEGAPEGRRWIIKHALRSLVKRGNPGALQLLGVGAKPRVEVRGVQIVPRRPAIGKTVVISFELASTARAAQELLIDYAVHFIKSNGAPRAKVFKLKRVSLAAKAHVQLKAKLSLSNMTTRQHYPGRHVVELLVNGIAFELCAFELCASSS